jgi:TatD DNase family protein
MKTRFSIFLISGRMCEFSWAPARNCRLRGCSIVSKIRIMIDTHCHLTDPRLASQLNFVLTRAAFAGVGRMITIGTGLEEDRKCVELCRRKDIVKDNVRCAVGVHPSYVDEEEFEQLAMLREIQADASVVAIGEIGLDYHRGKDNRQRQIDFLQWQLKLAVEVNKPLVIHCREAVDDCLAVLADFPGLAMVFHCFTGTVAEARRILDRGYLLGFTGVITFKNSGELREVVKLTPMDQLLIETDAPYLTPEPMRKQKVNEPALVTHVAAKVAELKKLPVSDVDQQTTANAAKLFQW